MVCFFIAIYDGLADADKMINTGATYEVFEAEQVAVGNSFLNLRPTKELR